MADEMLLYLADLGETRGAIELRRWDDGRLSIMLDPWPEVEEPAHELPLDDEDALRLGLALVRATGG